MMAVKVNIKTNKVTLDIKKTFESVRKNKQMLNDIGDFSVKRMQGFARKKTPLQGKKVGKFPANYPSEMTVKQRQYLEKFNKTHQAYRASKGNLTLTGQLLDAITFEVIRDFVKVFVNDNKRKPYRTGPRSRGKSLTNEQVYDFLISLNRKFRVLGMDEKGEKRITNIVKRYLRRALSVRRQLK